MKVYLLLLDDAESFFYSDEPEPGLEPAPDAEAPRPGLRGRLEHRWKAFQKGFYEADDGVALRARQAWDWLHTWTRPDEAMLVRLRAADRVDLHHPASRAEAVVRPIWEAYLAGRARAHRISFGYNAVLTVPVGVLLWPLPGPNVFGFWFLYRTIHHWMILRGIKEVRSGAIPTRFHPEPTLDLPVARGPDGAARHATVDGEGHRLGAYLARMDPGGPGGVRSAYRLIIPNSLSILRIVLALVFPWAPKAWRAALVFAAGLSDLFDGRLSRALGGTSTLGQVLDPVADKLFVGCVLVTLVLDGSLTVAELLLLGFRDIAVVGGSAWSVARRGWASIGQMPPTSLGKLATAGQLAFLLILTLTGAQANLQVRLVEAAAAASSVLAGLDYLFRKAPSASKHENSQL